MSLPSAAELEATLAVLSKYGSLRRFHLGGLQVEFHESPKSDPFESGQVTAPAATPVGATPAQSGNSTAEPVKVDDIFDVIASGVAVPGAPDRALISGT